MLKQQSLTLRFSGTLWRRSVRLRLDSEYQWRSQSYGIVTGATSTIWSRNQSTSRNDRTHRKIFHGFAQIPRLNSNRIRRALSSPVATPLRNTIELYLRALELALKKPLIHYKILTAVNAGDDDWKQLQLNAKCN